MHTYNILSENAQKRGRGYLRLLDSFVLCNLYAKDIFTIVYYCLQYSKKERTKYLQL